MDFDMLDDFWSLQQRPNNISGFREFDTPRWRFAAKPVPRLHPAFDDNGKQTLVVAPVGRVETFYHLGEMVDRDEILVRYAAAMDQHERMGGCKGMLRAIEQGVPLFKPSYRLVAPAPIDGPNGPQPVEFMSMHLSSIMIAAQFVNGGVQRFVRGDDRRCLWSIRETRNIAGRPVAEPSVLFAGHFDWVNPRGGFNPERDAILIMERDPVTQNPWLTILYRLLIKSGWAPEDIQKLFEQRTEYKEASDRLRASSQGRKFNLQEQLERVAPERRTVLSVNLNDPLNKKGAAPPAPVAPTPRAAPAQQKYGWCTNETCPQKHSVVYVVERSCSACQGNLKPSKARAFLEQMYTTEQVRASTGGQPDVWAAKQLRGFKPKEAPAVAPPPPAP